MDLNKINAINNISTRMEKMLVSFFDELIEQFPNEADFVTLRVLISSGQAPMSILLDVWIKNFEDDKKKIKERNPEFFTSSSGTLSSIGKTSIVDTFRRVWKVIDLDEDNKKTIWKWIDNFVIIVEKYKKLMSE
jgi:hypothetical protein